ncbi:MAG TPA: tetratricopeptide repeat protein [Steroidobacteraceae bacterium]|nr:tetratricopeptide repeat protein [Steroidobacteraceae bacterium]
MLYLIVSIALQALLIIHCIKTGRNQIWIWVLALLSFPGVIAYVAVELVPDLIRSRGARRAARGVSRVLDPGRDLRNAEQCARVAGNVASRQAYADELAKQGRHAEAIAEYRAALTGLYEHDPQLMLGLAQSLFTSGDAAGARDTLDALIAANPDFRSPDGHMLYARAVEATGDTAKALEEYAALAAYFPGAEASVRYAQLLRSAGRDEEARKVLGDLLEQARIAPAHYRRTQREWLAIAARELDQKMR